MRPEYKGNKFRNGNGAPEEDTKKKYFPGPGQYQTERSLNKTTFVKIPPAFSFPVTSHTAPISGTKLVKELK